MQGRRDEARRKFYLRSWLAPADITLSPNRLGTAHLRYVYSMTWVCTSTVTVRHNYEQGYSSSLISWYSPGTLTRLRFLSGASKASRCTQSSNAPLRSVCDDRKETQSQPSTNTQPTTYRGVLREALPFVPRHVTAHVRAFPCRAQQHWLLRVPA